MNVSDDGDRLLRVQKLYRDDLLNADAVYLSNALRGLLRVKLTAKEADTIGRPMATNGRE